MSDPVETLMKYDCISFDMFDTLIFRPFNTPTKLFDVVGEKLGIPGFRDKRVKAEKKARKIRMSRFGDGEVGISEIWDVLAPVRGISAEYGIEVETETEMKLCYADPYMIGVWEQLRRANKKIIVTTDMYLPAGTLAAILEKNGFVGYDRIFVSCEYRKNKAGGALYDEILKAYPDQRIIHIGDNPKSDHLQAVQHGIDARLIDAKERIKSDYIKRRNTLSVDRLDAETVVNLAKQYFRDWRTVFSAVRGLFDEMPVRNRIKTVGIFFYKIGSGGTERVLTALVKIWKDMGYRIVLFTEEAASGDDYEIPEDIPRIVLPASGELGGEGYRTRAAVLKDALENHHVDLMVYHAWISPVLLWDLLICRIAGTRFAVHCHNVFSQYMTIDPAGFVNLPYAYALADGVITLSNTDTRFWSEFNSNVFKTINPPAFSSVDDVPRSDCSGRTLIWCQRFSDEKNPEDAIEVFKLVREKVPDAELMILGQGILPDYRLRLERMVAEYGLRDSVTFLGYRKDVEEYYQKADVCLITSDYEGFPMGMVESMSTGVPVVMYELPYLTLAEWGKGVVSVPYKDIGLMADRISELLTDRDRLKTLGAEARSAAADISDYDQAAAWKNIFDRIEASSGQADTLPLMWDTMFSHARIGLDRIGVGNLQYQIDEIRNSKSYRVGRAITYLPRLIRHLLTGFPM